MLHINLSSTPQKTSRWNFFCNSFTNTFKRAVDYADLPGNIIGAIFSIPFVLFDLVIRCCVNNWNTEVYSFFFQGFKWFGKILGCLFLVPLGLLIGSINGCINAMTRCTLQQHSAQELINRINLFDLEQFKVFFIEIVDTYRSEKSIPNDKKFHWLDDDGDEGYKNSHNRNVPGLKTSHSTTTVMKECLYYERENNCVSGTVSKNSLINYINDPKNKGKRLYQVIDDYFSSAEKKKNKAVSRWNFFFSGFNTAFIHIINYAVYPGFVTAVIPTALVFILEGCITEYTQNTGFNRFACTKRCFNIFKWLGKLPGLLLCIPIGLVIGLINGCSNAMTRCPRQRVLKKDFIEAIAAIPNDNINVVTEEIITIYKQRKTCNFKMSNSSRSMLQQLKDYKNTEEQKKVVILNYIKKENNRGKKLYQVIYERQPNQAKILTFLSTRYHSNPDISIFFSRRPVGGIGDGLRPLAPAILKFANI